MSFTWDRFVRLPSWALESWPVTAPAVLACVHILIVTRFGLCVDEVVAVNKWTSAILQIVGGGMVLYSIDSNMGQFEPDSLKARLRGYFERFPFCNWVQTIGVDSAFHWSSVGTPTLRAVVGNGTLQGRVTQLEHDLKLLQLELNRTASEVRDELKAATERLEQRLRDTEAAASRIESNLKQMTRDGVGAQVFGVFLVFHGAVAGIFT